MSGLARLVAFAAIGILQFPFFNLYFSIVAIFLCISSGSGFLKIGPTTQLFRQALHLDFGAGVAMDVAIFLSVAEMFHQWRRRIPQM
jgi:hypothetical protein